MADSPGGAWHAWDVPLGQIPKVRTRSHGGVNWDVPLGQIPQGRIRSHGGVNWGHFGSSVPVC